MKVSELTGALLDYWVARANGDALPRINNSGVCGVVVECEDGQAGTKRVDFCPSSDWSLAGQVIERERITLSAVRSPEQGGPDPGWCGIAGREDARIYMHGATPLIAAMRAFVASKFGAEVSDAV